MGEARPKVYSIAVEVTAHCQQKCDYCYNAWREDNGASIGSQKRLHARVEKLLSALDVDHVTVTGGEPFARKDIFELLDVIKASGTGIQMISNGGLIDDAVASRLSTYDVGYVQVTLDGPDAALHEEHVGKGHFAPTIRGIEALVRHGVHVVGCIVVTRKNAARVGKILALFQSLGVNDYALSRFSPAGYAARFAAALLPSREDLLVAFRQAIPFARAGSRISCTMPVPPCTVETEELEPLQFGMCAIGTDFQEFALGPDGKLRHCTLHGSHLGGDVLDEDPVAIVQGSVVRDYKKTVPAFCAGCLHEQTCGGGCGAAAEWVLGSRNVPDPFVWQHIDDDFSKSLKQKRRLEVLS